MDMLLRGKTNIIITISTGLGPFGWPWPSWCEEGIVLVVVVVLVVMVGTELVVLVVTKG